MKKIVKFLISICFLASLIMTILSLAHPVGTEGRRDVKVTEIKKNVSSLGGYDYHCNYSDAYLHPDGICPNTDEKLQSTTTPISTKTPSTKLTLEKKHEPQYYTKFPTVISYGYLANMKPISINEADNFTFYEYLETHNDYADKTFIEELMNDGFVYSGKIYNDTIPVLANNKYAIIIIVNSESSFSIGITDSMNANSLNGSTNINIDKNTSPKSLQVLLNGKTLDFDFEPEIENGIILIPIRAIIDVLSFKAEYVPESKKAVINDEFVLTIGSKIALLSSTELTLVVAPKIINDYTYVPLKFLSEAFNMEILWSETKDGKVVNLITK